MAVIADDTHAVSPGAVVSVVKLEVLADPPQPSYWYLAVAGASISQMLRFDVVDARDEFYKRLVDAMG